jgi:hypothetical protein
MFKFHYSVLRSRWLYSGPEIKTVIINNRYTRGAQILDATSFLQLSLMLWHLICRGLECHLSGAYNLEVTPRVLENLWTLVSHEYQM